MKRTLALMTVVCLAFSALLLFSCEQPEMDDSIEPHEKFFDQMIRDGEQNVSLTEAISYYVGAMIDPVGLTNDTVCLRVQGGSTVEGSVGGFDKQACDILTTGKCPLGVFFQSVCDLSPNTAYELVLDDLVMADGSTLSETITFTTGDTPPGYTPSPCPLLVTGNTLDPAQGISGNLTTEVHDLDIVAAGIETGPPYSDYRNLTRPRYIALLKIYPVMPYDLSSTVQWLYLRINGADLQVELPPTNISAGKSLVLYIAENGSTYYALDTADGTTDMSSGECDSAGSGCPAYTPDQAYLSANLAAGSSADLAPLKIQNDDLNQKGGLNGGVLDGVVPPVTTFSIYLIQSRAPYYGWDQLNNSASFEVSYWTGGTYSAVNPSYPRDYSPFVMGHIRTGDSFEEIEASSIPTYDSWLLLYIENKDASSFSLAPYPTVEVTDEGEITSISLPAENIPAGEALPLYVDKNGRTFYAFEDGGDHTLDLEANMCDGSTTCPTMDPVTSMTEHPAAP